MVLAAVSANVVNGLGFNSCHEGSRQICAIDLCEWCYMRERGISVSRLDLAMCALSQ